MKTLLIEFILRCDKHGVTPAEKEIDAFLNSAECPELRDYFIRFCFYCWESRKELIEDELKFIAWEQQQYSY